MHSRGATTSDNLKAKQQMEKQNPRVRNSKDAHRVVLVASTNSCHLGLLSAALGVQE